MGPQADLREWRIIDCDDARGFTKDEIAKGDFRKWVMDEQRTVSLYFRVSSALWSLRPRVLLEIDSHGEYGSASSSSSVGQSGDVEESEALGKMAAV